MSHTSIVLAVLVAYTLALWALARTRTRRDQSMDYYHVADRTVGWKANSLAIASAWIWAPALFVASTQSFTNGWVGAAWFIVPNALALALMLPFALKIREKYPSGFTLSGLMRRKYGRATQNWYLTSMGGLSLLAIAVNLLAGGTVLSMLTGLPLLITSGLFLLLVMTYTYRYGIKASIITEVTQIVLIVAILVILVPSTLHFTGWDAVSAGLHGINNITGFFDASGVQVAATFGIISAVGLAAGPVGDQAFWQRAFAAKREDVARSFGWGAVAFSLVPLLMTFFGFAAAGRAFAANNPGYVNLELVQAYFPEIVTVPFMLMLCASLFSAINSHLLSVATLASDVVSSLPVQRKIMAAAGLLALLVANVPGNSVASMFLIYSTLRSSIFIITLTTLLGKQWHARATAWGIGVGVGVGFPLAVYGNLVVNQWQVRLVAIAFTTLAPWLIVMGWTALRGKPAGEVEPGYRTEAEKVSALAA